MLIEYDNTGILSVRQQPVSKLINLEIFQLNIVAVLEWQTLILIL